MDLDQTHPSLADLARRARRRLPRFVWEYLDSGTGDDSARRANAAALDAVRLRPRVLRPVAPDLGTRFLGRDHPLPLGIAPVGMSGLVWPGAERSLAGVAARAGVPYCLSTVAADTPEAIGPETGGQGWFQLYPPGAPEIRRDLLARARDAGFSTLILTADVPVASRRERLRRARISNPMRMRPTILAQVAARPAWALATLRAGIPKLRTLERYIDASGARSSTEHAGYLLRTAPDWDYLAALRAEWDGALVVKGVLDPADAGRLVNAGVDAIWVSNHGGRQFDAAPAALEALGQVRAALGGDVPLIYDGGVRSGTDVLRAIAHGADLVMLGRAFHHGLAAFGVSGAAHVLHVLAEGMRADMAQLGIARPAAARDRL